MFNNEREINEIRQEAIEGKCSFEERHLHAVDRAITTMKENGTWEGTQVFGVFPFAVISEDGKAARWINIKR